VRDYDSMQIGTTVFAVGIAQIFSTIIAARLSQFVDPRKTVTVGLILFACSLWLTSHITPDWGFGAFLAPQLLRGFSIMLCIVPSVSMALSGFEMAELRYASGLFNLMRNLGGAIGIAIVTTLLQDETRIHIARIGETLGEAGRHATGMVAELASRFSELTPDSAHAVLLAKAELGQVVTRTALTLGFNEVFRFMAWMFLAALLMVPFCRPIRSNAPTPPDAH
jgi:DHA2 family multidrug resistance protein